MKPAPFEYHAPESLADVVSLLAEHGDDAKVLAGGQSLVPMLALRLTRFDHIIDLNRVGELQGVDACQRHAHGEGHDPPVRRRARCRRGRARCRCSRWRCRSSGTSRSGTGAPSAGRSPTPTPPRSCPAVALALDAELEVAGAGGTRRVPAADFFLGTWTTTIERRRDPRGGALPRVVRADRLRGRGDRPPAAVTSPSPAWSCAVEFNDAGAVTARRSRSWHGPTPVRARAAEAELNGTTPTAPEIAEIAPSRGRRYRSHCRRPRVGRVPHARRCAPRGTRAGPSPGSGTSWLNSRSHSPSTARRATATPSRARPSPTSSARTRAHRYPPRV